MITKIHLLPRREFYRTGLYNDNFRNATASVACNYLELKFFMHYLQSHNFIPTL